MTDGNLGDANPQIIGDDLRQRRRRALAVRRRASYQRQLAARINSQKAALVRSETGQHHVRRHADAQQLALLPATALFTLALAPRPVLRELERTVETVGVGAAVVDNRCLG